MAIQWPSRPLRTSCALTTASDKLGNRCSTFQTSTLRDDDSARKNDLLQNADVTLPAFVMYSFGSDN